jgi:hypothetical protein
LDDHREPGPAAELPGTQSTESWYKGSDLIEHGKKPWPAIKRLKDVVPAAYHAAWKAIGSKNSDEQGLIAPDSQKRKAVSQQILTKSIQHWIRASIWRS